MNVSVVIPVYNEEDSVQPLFVDIKNVLDKTSFIDDYEIIFIDDGSRDLTYQRLCQIGNDKVRIVKFRNNEKKTAALMRGFDVAKNGIIVTLDGDLQDDVEAIPVMLQKIDKGHDAVIGWRKERNDSLVRIVSSRVASVVQRGVLKDDFHDIGCPLRAFRREVVDSFETFEGAHRFFPFFIMAAGYRITQCPVRHYARRFGCSKYGIRNRILKTTTDLIKVRRMMGNRKKL